MAEDLKVQPIGGELFRFYVESRTRPNYPHTVDLEDWKFNGGCSCERFKFGCEPLLSRGADPADHLRCAHIKRARSYFADEVLPKIAGQVKPLARQATLVEEAAGRISAIAVADEERYPLEKKLGDLMELAAHVNACISQVREEVDDARDPHKHEDPQPVEHPGDDVPFE